MRGYLPLKHVFVASGVLYPTFGIILSGGRRCGGDVAILRQRRRQCLASAFADVMECLGPMAPVEFGRPKLQWAGPQQLLTASVRRKRSDVPWISGGSNRVEAA